MRYKAFTLQNINELPQFKKLNKEVLNAIEIVSRVLPFKTNNYVVNELINWDNYENDPMFILNFPQKEMLHKKDFESINNLISKNSDINQVKKEIKKIREGMNPHPAGQIEYNTPILNGQRLMGLQHKYKETLLFFPSQGQTCHAYCSFCFRWPQFIGDKEIKLALKESEYLIEYLKEHTEITDLLITGGDPLVMSADLLDKYISQILNANIQHLRTIRIGSKSLTFWPYRFLTDNDADDILRVFEKVQKAGKSLAFMAHFNHPQELSTPAVEKAIARIRSTGVQIRTQAPLLDHINTSDDIWSSMWQRQVNLGLIPYYMFVARNTGANNYFGVSLANAWNIYRSSIKKVSGIARTARGPVMSCMPGKIRINGVVEIRNEKVFVLEFIQGRNPDWVGKPFFAKYDKNATWYDDLVPAFNKEAFFFEDYMNNLFACA
ncbi:MAG: lysine 2,3-aminomutase [Marinilabiliaceae bacterium]|nr:lysine 2,3-aminomutase [Marinilabiliaceae bacterium]